MDRSSPQSSTAPDREGVNPPPPAGLTEDDRGLLEMFADSLRGPRGWLVRAALIKGGLFFAFGVYCAAQAILATDVRSVVLWSLGAVWSMAVIVTVKLWWWMEVNRRSILRSLGRESTGTTRWSS